MNVYTLLHVPREELLDSCTILFKSFRTGFPTAKLIVGINDTGVDHNLIAERIPADAFIQLRHEINRNWEHSEFIETMLRTHPAEDGPAVFLDPDVILWEKVEHWTFPTLLAGNVIPQHWCDSTRCISVPRIHTSFLWVTDPVALRAKLETTFEFASSIQPFNPFAPQVLFKQGQAVFYDNCANLFQALGGTPFSPEHLNAYEHLHSASCYDLALASIQNKEGFKWVHSEGVKNWTSLRGLLQASQARYYRDKQIEGLVRAG